MPTNLASDVLLDQVVLAVVAKNGVHFLGPRAANVRAEHEVVGRLAVEVLLVDVGGHQLEKFGFGLNFEN